MPDTSVESAPLSSGNARKERPEIGGCIVFVRMLMVLILNAMISFIIVQTLPYFYTILYSNDPRRMIERLSNDPKLSILAVHSLNLPIINTFVILAILLRACASRKQCICRVKQATAPAELLIVLQITFVSYVALKNGVLYCKYLPISLVQYFGVRLAYTLLHCPCRYCQGKPVMYFTYMDKTIEFNNFDFSLIKTFRTRLAIPPGPFLLYNTYRNEYFTSENLMELVFPVYTNERKRYIIKPLDEFHSEEADLLRAYVKRIFPCIKNAELEMLILANHPSIRHYFEA